MRVGVIYFDSYADEEMNRLAAIGVQTHRLRAEDVRQGISVGMLRHDVSYCLRGRRMAPEEFRNLWESITDRGIRLVTTPGAFEIASRFSRQVELLGDLTPRALVFGRDVSAEEIQRGLEAGGLQEPLFMRSDTESAAKYVGVAACTIEGRELGKVAEALGTLREHVKMYQEIIVKELVPIRMTNGGVPFEYRAIGIGGRLLCFDGQSEALPSPQSSGMDSAASEALGRLAAGGCDGGLFVDVGVTEEGRCIVVEVKDLLNGTIRSPEVFGGAIKRWS